MKTAAPTRETLPHPRIGRARRGLALILKMLLLAGLFGAGAQPLHAQSGTAIFPNYGRIPIGEIGGMEGGAFIARVADASAGWYNPAGLGKAEKSSISGNAVAYEQIGTRGAGFKEQTTTNEIPTFFGGLKRLGKSFAIALSVSSPVNINTTSELTATNKPVIDPSQNSSQVITVTERSRSAANLTLISPALSLAWEVTDSFRIGVGARLYQTSLSSSLTHRVYETGTKYNDFLASEETLLRGEALLSATEAGVQIEISERLIVGALYRARSNIINSSGRYQFDAVRAFNIDYDQDGVFDSRFTFAGRNLSDKERFAYIVPREISVGIAYVGTGIEMEVDRRCYEQLKYFHMFGGGQTLLYEGGDEQIQVSSSELVEPIKYSAAAICNNSVGVRMKPGDSFHLHLGYFEDHSPVSPSSDAFPDRFGGSGATAGFSIIGKNSSLSFGAVSYVAEPEASAAESGTQITANSLIIAASYYFN